VNSLCSCHISLGSLVDVVCVFLLLCWPSYVNASGHESKEGGYAHTTCYRQYMMIEISTRHTSRGQKRSLYKHQFILSQCWIRH
jgi:hypothetical protein